MISKNLPKADPRLDLVLERVVDAPRQLVWQAWTTPEHLKNWFTPLPWTTPECEIDLRPGGLFRTVMRSPEGECHTNIACYLEVIPGELLIWTDALAPGYRPNHNPPMAPPEVGRVTVFIRLEDEGKGTRYTATCFHQGAEGKAAHERLGFFEGWGTVTDQMAAYAKTIGSR